MDEADLEAVVRMYRAAQLCDDLLKLRLLDDSGLHWNHVCRVVSDRDVLHAYCCVESLMIMMAGLGFGIQVTVCIRARRLNAP